VHVLGRAEDRIYRTGLDTQGAANAHLLINYRQGFGFFLATVRVQGFGLDAQQLRQGHDSGLPAGRALVNIRLSAGDGLRIRAATRVVALAALGLWKNCIDPVNHRVGFHLKFPRSPTQAQPKKTADNRNCQNRRQHLRVSPAR